MIVKNPDLLINNQSTEEKRLNESGNLNNYRRLVVKCPDCDSLTTLHFPPFMEIQPSSVQCLGCEADFNFNLETFQNIPESVLSDQDIDFNYRY